MCKRRLYLHKLDDKILQLQNHGQIEKTWRSSELLLLDDADKILTMISNFHIMVLCYKLL